MKKFRYSIVLLCIFASNLIAQTDSTSRAPRIDVVKPVEIKEPVKSIETTLAIIKPDAVQNGDSGFIIQLIELNGFNIKNLEKMQLTQKQAEEFYKVHKDRPFYKELVNYMTSGPVIVMALSKENAIKDWRELMGATNPEKSGLGTMRRMFGSSITQNATHGSDSLENAKCEVAFFFS